MKFSTYFILGLFLIVLFLDVSAQAFTPPCQDVLTAWRDGATVHYQVHDPISGEDKKETWTLDLGDQIDIDPLVAKQGIVAWVAKYRYGGQEEFNYTVQYRIFDPGRGTWQSGEFGWLDESYGTLREIYNFEVNDGVVAFMVKYQHRDAPDPYDQQHLEVYGAAYDPFDGAWKCDGVQIADQIGCHWPKLMNVEHGILAWGRGDESGTAYVQTYDYEVHRWVKSYCHYIYPERDLDEIHIKIGRVRAHWGFWFGPDGDAYFTYDPYAHRWEVETADMNWALTTEEDWPDPIPRASFIAQPSSGLYPFWVTFWDTSFAIAVPSYNWDFGDGTTSRGFPSPIHSYESLGSFQAQMTVMQPVPYALYTDTHVINVEEAPITDAGILINSGAIYTTSMNVMLCLKAETRVTEMCFHEGTQPWSPWEPYANRKFYQLSSAGGVTNGVHTVYAKFRTAMGTESSVYSDAITVDVSPPEASVVIENGDLYATSSSVNVDVTATDNDPAPLQMSWAVDDGSGETWWSLVGPVSTNLTADLGSTDGEKIVYARLYDGARNVYQASDSIILDLHSPTGSIFINEGRPKTGLRSVALRIEADDHGGSGVVEMSITNDLAIWAPWREFINTRYGYMNVDWTLPAGDGEKTVYVRFRDRVGRVSDIYSDSIILDTGDSEPDGMPDYWEIDYFGSLDRDGSGDFDGDGLTDLQEFEAGTDPTITDTDGDGMPDVWEVANGTNPILNDAGDDLDGDKCCNLIEYQRGTLPDDPSSKPSKAMPWIPLLLLDE